jgi:TetR/AcrR family tetracycline transcriptional repressor
MWVPLDRGQVVAEALRLVDENGLDGLSLRTLGNRLGVQAPTLYWHVGNKAALLDALADAVMDEVLDALQAAGPGEDRAEWLLTALFELRRAMLRHRDGARIVSGARLSLRRGDFSELAMSTLADHGVDLHRARLLVLAGERFTVGYVLEEQAPADDAGQTPDIDGLRRRFPVATRAITEYFAPGRTSDDLYRDIARLILGLPPQL